MMRVLVTGANGQLGMSLRRLLSADTYVEAVYTDVDTLDLTDRDAVERFVGEGGFDYIVNCAAYTAVDKAESDEFLCTKINTEAVGNIAVAARKHKVRVIHVSTDYVFNGENYRPYEENDTPEPRSIYGRTKLEGEGVLMSFCPSSIIIRTAWLYSEYGSNFVKTMLRIGVEKGEVSVVSDQIGTPTYAGDLAAVIVGMLKMENPTAGVYHFTNEGVASWYDFAKAIFRIAGKQVKVTPIRTKDYPTATKRPLYSVLNKTKIKTTFGIEIPYWEESLECCISNMNK